MYGPLEPVCLNCRRPLDGAGTGACGVCGAPRTVRLEFPSPDLYNRALEVLRSRALVRQSREPGGGLASVVATYVGFSPGAIWIDADREEEAAEALEAVDVFLYERGVPIVDRSEPLCPRCSAQLDLDGPSVCRRCGAAYQWVDITEPPLDPTGRCCKECGYELTGTDAERCPECGVIAPLERDLDALVDAATAALPAEPETSAGSAAGQRRAPVLLRVLASLAVVMVILFLVLMLMGLPVGGAIAPVLAALCLLLLLVARPSQR